MKKSAKIVISVLLIAALVSITVSPALADFSSGSVKYVAFGDSVAAGVRGGVSESSSAYGYTDILASDLESASVLSGFSEDFCTSGKTAAQLAEDTKVLTDTSSSGYALAKDADLVTLTIGANDILAPVLKSLSGTQSISASQIKECLTAAVAMINDGKTAPAVQANIETILENILSAAPKAKIFVMGYYNPLPAASALVGVDLDTPLKTFNVYIHDAVSNVSASYPDASITYVDTMSAIAADASNYLVTSDVHPTEAGYKVLAGVFWTQIDPLVPDVKISAPTGSSVLVNGKSVAFEAYNIDNSNYFKLRDLAMSLSGSGKQFNVNWDSNKSAISLTSSTAYVSVGGELSSSGNTAEAKAVQTSSAVYLDGKSVSLTAYNIGGYNYIKLRDLASVLNFYVGFDSSTSTISIDTSTGYTA